MSPGGRLQVVAIPSPAVSVGPMLPYCTVVVVILVIVVLNSARSHSVP